MTTQINHQICPLSRECKYSSNECDDTYFLCTIYRNQVTRDRMKQEQAMQDNRCSENCVFYVDLCKERYRECIIREVDELGVGATDIGLLWRIK